MILESVKAVTDTLSKVADKHGGSGWIMHHVLDSRELGLEPFGIIHLPQLHLFGLDISITKHIIFMWLAAIIVLLIFSVVARSYKKSLVPKGFTNFWEILIVFVRDEIAKPTIGEGYQKFLPFLLSTFFFILTMNFLGLLPYGNTATSNIAITSTLAVFSFIVIQGSGMKKNGVFGYFKGLVPHGIPIVFLPVLFIVEILGLFTKPFALAVRLFANMTAGHIIIFSLIGLIFVLQTYFVAPVSIAFALFIDLLEILVALIQAYIFTILTSLFIGMAVHQDH